MTRSLYVSWNVAVAEVMLEKPMSDWDVERASGTRERPEAVDDGGDDRLDRERIGGQGGRRLRAGREGAIKRASAGTRRRRGAPAGPGDGVVGDVVDLRHDRSDRAAPRLDLCVESSEVEDPSRGPEARGDSGKLFVPVSRDVDALEADDVPVPVGESDLYPRAVESRRLRRGSGSTGTPSWRRSWG